MLGSIVLYFYVFNFNIFYLFYQRERKVQVYERSSSSYNFKGTIITNDMLSGVLNEIVGLLPVCIPVMITFIALRKGYSICSKHFTLSVRLLLVCIVKDVD